MALYFPGKMFQNHVAHAKREQFLAGLGILVHLVQKSIAVTNHRERAR